MAGRIDNIELQERAYYTNLSNLQESPEAKENIYAIPLDTSCSTQKYVSNKKSPFPDTEAAMADTGIAVMDELTTMKKVRKYWKKKATKRWLGGIIGATFVVLSIASITANIVLIIALYNKIPCPHCDKMGCPAVTNELVGNSTLSNLAQKIVNRLQESNNGSKLVETAREVCQDIQCTTDIDMQDILLSALQNNTSNAIEQSRITTLDSLTNITDTLSTDIMDTLSTHIETSNNETVSKITTTMDELAQEITFKLQESNKLVITDIQALLPSVMQNNTATLVFLTSITDTLTNIEMSNNKTVSKILTRMDELAQEVTMKLYQINKLVEKGQEGYQDIQHFITTDIQALLLSVLQNNTATLAFLTRITDTLIDTEISNNKTFNKILTRMDELLVKNELTSNLICPTSCQAIRNNHPTSPSGYYSINGRLVYCEMGELCGNEGGWTRLAYLNMSDPSEECPSTFQMMQSHQIKVCGRSASDSSGCTSVRFPSHGISYSEVCGRVVGYQYGSTDAVDGNQKIDSNYVDGISITYGCSPRKHVWTLYADLSETSNNCPCSTSQSTPSFVGNDYFCESGNPSNVSENKLYTDDPLWDGEGCGTNEGSCCLAPGLPWFHKTLNTTTTDYLELRSCGDASPKYENAFFSIYELFVK